MPIEPCADAPVAVTSAAAFSFDGQCYLFGGRSANSNYSNHLYRYDPTKDQWCDLGATPLTPRVRPRAVTVGENVYIGLGFNGKVLEDSAYLTDWWKWTPATNHWETLSEYPSDRTVGPVVVSDGTFIYTAFGGKQNFERWIFRYDIQKDQWLQMADGIERMASYPPRAHSACGAYCQGRWFFGAGYTRDKSSNFWVEAKMERDSVIWHKRLPIQGRRHNATAVSDNKYIYLAGGSFLGGTVTTGSYYDDIVRYDPEKDQWICITHMPEERENMVSWLIDGVLYVGMGNDKRNQPCKQLYRIRL